MTDSTQVPTTPAIPAIDINAVLARMATREAEIAKLVPANKANIFAALAAAGVTLVTVTFDGCGDSGQIEDILAFRGDEQTDLPAGTVEILHAPRDGGEPVANFLSPSEAIEEMAYDLLAQHQCGWENSEGSYGEFTFNVAADKIELDFNGRITTSDHYSYEW